MSTKKSSVKSVREAIQSLMGEAAFSLSEGLGRVVVTTSDRVPSMAFPQVGNGVLASVFSEDSEFSRIISEQRKAKESAIRAIGIVDGCAIVRHKKTPDQWKMILPDASEQGKWRTQSFDLKGFSGHATFDTKDLAIHSAAESGFSVRDDGALDSIQDSPEFQRGLYVSELVGLVNSGKVTHSLADKMLETYDTSQAISCSLVNDHVQAFTSGKERSTYLLADRISVGSEIAVYLHEITHRHGKLVLGVDGFDRLLRPLMGWSLNLPGTIERIIHDKARVRALNGSNGDSVVYGEEFLAYAVEEAVLLGVLPKAMAHPDSAQAWLEDVVCTFRGVIGQILSGRPVSIDSQSIVDIAYAMAQLDSPERIKRIREQMTQQELHLMDGIKEKFQLPDSISKGLFTDELVKGVAEYSADAGLQEAQRQCAEVISSHIGRETWMKSPKGVSTELTQAQWILVRTSNFKNWFGDWENDSERASQVMNWNTGEPLVMYHGTKDGGFTEFRSEYSKHDAIFFSSDPVVSASYSSNLEEIDLTPKEIPEGDYKDEESGIYSVFLNARKPLIEDFEGANWDGSRESFWMVSDEEGNPIPNADGVQFFISSQMAELHLDSLDIFGEVLPAIQHHHTTNSATAEAKRWNSDAAMIFNVVDEGSHGTGSDASLVVSVFDSSQIKSATYNTGEYNRSNSDIRYSKSSIEIESIFPQNLKQWFEGSFATVDGLPTDRPLMVFHGGKETQSDDHDGSMFWATSSRFNADFYSDGEIQNLYVCLKNPLIIDSQKASPSKIAEEAYRDVCEGRAHWDGVIFMDIVDGTHPSVVYAVFLDSEESMKEKITVVGRTNYTLEGEPILKGLQPPGDVFRFDRGDEILVGHSNRFDALSEKAVSQWRQGGLARHDSLEVDVSYCGHQIEINSIKVDESARGNGLAKKSIESLLSQADKYLVPVILEVGGYDAGIDGSLQSLIGWYERLGFQWDKDGSCMKRTPQIQVESPQVDLFRELELV